MSLSDVAIAFAKAFRVPLTPLLATLPCIIVATIFVAYSIGKRRKGAAKRLPPGKLDWPVGGLRYFREGFNDLCSFPGDVPRKMRLLFRPTVLVRQFDQIKMLLGSDGDLTEVSWPASTAVLLGRESVTYATGAYHRSLRRLLGPCFSPQAIETYLHAIQRICERYCAEWAAATAAAAEAAVAAAATRTAAGSGGDGKTASVDNTSTELLPKMQKEARQLTFEVMATVVAGLHLTPQQLAALSDAFDTFTRGIFSPLPLALPGSAYAKARAARRFITSTLDAQINASSAAHSSFSISSSKHGGAKRTPGDDTGSNSDSGDGSSPSAASPQLDKNGANVKDGSNGGGGSDSDVHGTGGGSVLQRLLGMRGDDGKPLSRTALQDIAVNLLFAGHETTATSVMRLVMLLQSRPDVVGRLRQEQRAAVRIHGQDITGSALREMPYLDAVVKETWRLHPVVSGVPRRAKRNFRLAGFDVPQGWGLSLGLQEPLKDAPVWQGVPDGSPNDPRVFNPDRWVAVPAAPAAPEGPNNNNNAGNKCGPGPSSGPLAGLLAPGQLRSPQGALPPFMLTFGGGSRYCLGANLAWAELKVFLCVWARGYEFRCPLPRLHTRPFPALSITAGLPVQVRPLPPDETEVDA